jgi:heat shock protein HtpX
VGHVTSRRRAPAEGVERAAVLFNETATRYRREEQGSLREAQRANRRRGSVTLAVPTLVLLVLVGFATFLILPLAVGVGLAVLLILGALAIAAYSPQLLLAQMAQLRGVGPDEARLTNLVDSLCSATGTRRPRIGILADQSPNAVMLQASGFGGERANPGVLICTTGLLAHADRIELEAVLAHELCHLRRGDAASATIAAVICGLFARSPRLVLGRAGAAREARADLAGATLTHYPPGLIRALESMSACAPLGESAMTRLCAAATGPLWFIPLPSSRSSGTPLPGALTVEERLAMLREL